MLDDNEEGEDDGVGGDWEVLDKPGLLVTPPMGNGESGTGSSSTHSSLEGERCGRVKAESGRYHLENKVKHWNDFGNYKVLI